MEKGFSDHKQDALRLLLIGKSGAGKSATGNTILGKEEFNCKLSFQAVTDKCTTKRCNHLQIEVVDTPGLYHHLNSEEDVAAHVLETLAMTSPGSSIVLFVMNIGRFLPEDVKVYNRFKTLFGHQVFHKTIVVFTGGDSLKEDIDDVLREAPQELKQMLKAVGNRYVVMDNRNKPESQVRDLVEMARQLKNTTRKTPFAFPKFAMTTTNQIRNVVARHLMKLRDRERHVKFVTFKVKAPGTRLPTYPHLKETEQSPEKPTVPSTLKGGKQSPFVLFGSTLVFFQFGRSLGVVLLIGLFTTGNAEEMTSCMATVSADHLSAEITCGFSTPQAIREEVIIQKLHPLDSPQGRSTDIFLVSIGYESENGPLCQAEKAGLQTHCNETSIAIIIERPTKKDSGKYVCQWLPATQHPFKACNLTIPDEQTTTSSLDGSTDVTASGDGKENPNEAVGNIGLSSLINDNYGSSQPANEANVFVVLCEIVMLVLMVFD